MLLDTYLKCLLDHLPKQKDSAQPLRKAYQNLHQRYQADAHSTGSSGFKGQTEIESYILARAPATYAVAKGVFDEIPENHIQEIKEKKDYTILDLGAGPGTASLALLQKLDHPSIKLTLFEQDESLVTAASQALPEQLPNLSVTTTCGNLMGADLPVVDFVLSSYVLTEMPTEKARAIYQTSLKAAQHLNLVILPGTPTAFALLINLRNLAIEHGFQIIAPCPHHEKCPMNTNDQSKTWCHFRQRLPRSAIHQTIKNGDRSYEDEPYCYLLVKAPPYESQAQAGRIVQHPLKKPGHMYLDLCDSNGQLKKICISKKNKEHYQQAKTKSWGDTWPN